MLKKPEINSHIFISGNDNSTEINLINILKGSANINNMIRS